jgi:hypothetical protein
VTLRGGRGEVGYLDVLAGKERCRSRRWELWAMEKAGGGME